eukprot:TRINITY_DN9334_c0_g1_i4.p1 TRINITY_DN9334_c0_g1~~TRINITY_DN9334_c0_g1_i4.p1  ORF type:complete len:260 (-),score=27.97 TRINITY_DN9334_c0_g1_i4:289-1068(-)
MAAVIWRKYAIFGLISRSQADSIASYHDGTPEERRMVLEDSEHACQLVEGVFSLFPHSCVEPPDLLLALGMVHGILTEEPNHCRHFRSAKLVNPFKRLLTLLESRQEVEVMRFASEIYARLIWPGAGNGVCLHEQAHWLLDRRLVVLFEQTCPMRTVEGLVGCFKILLREPTLRHSLEERYSLSRELPALTIRCAACVLPPEQPAEAEQASPPEMFTEGFSTDLMYHLIFVLWLLAFDSDAMEKMTGTGIVPVVIRLCK